MKESKEVRVSPLPPTRSAFSSLAIPERLNPFWILGQVLLWELPCLPWDFALPLDISKDSASRPNYSDLKSPIWSPGSWAVPARTELQWTPPKSLPFLFLSLPNTFTFLLEHQRGKVCRELIWVSAKPSVKENPHGQRGWVRLPGISPQRMGQVAHRAEAAKGVCT